MTKPNSLFANEELVNITQNAPLIKGTKLKNGMYEIYSDTTNAGGFGRIYQAKNTVKNTIVAIKEFYVSQETLGSSYSITLNGNRTRGVLENMLNQFAKEVEVLSKISGVKGIHVPLIDGELFSENGTQYYAMSYINGLTLTDTIKQDGAMSEEKAVTYIGQVGKVLHEAHQCEMVHCDVSPNNIMLHNENAVLVDFGNAKSYNTDKAEKYITRKNMENYYAQSLPGTGYGFSLSRGYTISLEIGTPGFAPPSSHRGTVQGDVYSLAATLYYILTKEKPPYFSETKRREHCMQDELVKHGVSQTTIHAILHAMDYDLNSATKDIMTFLCELPQEIIIRSLLTY